MVATSVAKAAILASAVLLAGAQDSSTTTCSAGEDVLLWGATGLAGCGTMGTSLVGCCGNVLPSDSAIQVDDGVCRTSILESAYCENPNLGCDNFEPNSTHTVTFDVAMTYAAAGETCCQKCKCYGDPLCEAFDGSRDQMIECDARNMTSCELQQDICRQQYDHAGNRCKWLKGNDNFPWWQSNLADGSPCQADYNVSGQLELVMLDYDGLRLSTLIGERGVQTDFMITLPGYSEPYSISSSVCFDYDPRDVGTANAANAWVLPSNVSEIPSSWTVTIPNSVEIRWHIGDDDLGIYADVICNKAIGATRTRLDIENVTDTQSRTGGEGYCFTGVIDTEQQSGTNTDDTLGHFTCVSRNLPDLANTCKALTDDTCYPRTIDGWQQYWCEKAELQYTQASSGANSYEEMVATCLSDIRTGTEDERATTWDRYACQMNSQLPYGGSAQNSYVDECLNRLEENGWYIWAQNYEGLIAHDWTAEERCVSSIDEFTTIPEDLECASGLVVEVNQSGTWVPVLYFPPESPPCSDASIEANGAQFPELFLYQVRMRQCGLAARCLVKDEGTECQPVVSIDAELSFSGVLCQLSGEDCSTCVRDYGSTESPQVCQSGDTEEYYVGFCEECCLTNNYLPEQESQSCRELVINTPFCDSDDDSMSSICNQLDRRNVQGMLTLNVSAPDSGFYDKVCCDNCALWGDPFGQSFNGTREKLIVCDARDTSCFSQQDVCENLLDHAGNPCVWNQTVRDLIGNNRGNIGAYGSPCLPDYERSGENEVVLYEVANPSYKLSFYTGERSILDQMLLTTPRGSYRLDPLACYDDDVDYPGWTTVSGEDVSTALVLNFTDAGEHGYGNDDRVWAVYEPDMGIFFRVTCVNSKAITSDFVGGYRLNIEHLIDTDLTRDNTDGFCVTADLRAYGQSYTQNTDAEECEETNLNAAHSACKAFWSGACTPDQIDLGIERWCTIANQPKTVQKCVNSIKRSSATRTAKLWTRAVCTALLPMKQPTDSDADFLRSCEDLAETEGYYAIVENYGSAGDRASVQSYCASSPSEYGMRDDVDACINGVSVQYYDGSDWVEVFFMPSNYLPCDGILQLPATSSKYLPLFTNPIRFQQCDVDNSENGCPASQNVEATCMSNFGFQIGLTYSYSDNLDCSSAGGSS